MSATSPFSYTWTPARPLVRQKPGVSTSRTEVLHLLAAYAVLTFDLLFLFSGSSVLFGTSGVGLLSSTTLELLAIAATAALTAFVCHELAHKIVAERRGFWAEFRMSVIGLAMSFVTVFLLGVLWAAPGATVVSVNPADRETWGRTSLAGPMTNVAFSVGFYAAATAAFWYNEPVFAWLLLLAFINGWFAAFNLIPIGPLDGRKVLHWNAGYWVAAIVGAGFLAVVSYLALYYYGTPLLGY
jgi:Zn-dependent protease